MSNNNRDMTKEQYEERKLNPQGSTWGKYDSYGNSNKITWQSKVNRELAEKYDVVRRLMGKSRRESLEDYFRHEIEIYRSSDWKSQSALNDFFTDESEDSP